MSLEDSLRKAGFHSGNVQITVNPSDAFLQEKMAEVFRDPEADNVKVTGYWFKDPNTGFSHSGEHIVSVDLLKEDANALFRAGKYKQAIELYTQALARFPTAPIETKRTILSNRAQSHLLLGDLLAAFRDTDQALSAELTTADSPRPMTMKLHYRRAKVNLGLQRYEEAWDDFARFEEIGKRKLTPEEEWLKEHIISNLPRANLDMVD